MELYKKIVKRLERDETIFCNETLAKDLAEISKEHVSKEIITNLLEEMEGVHSEYHYEIVKNYLNDI